MFKHYLSYSLAISFQRTCSTLEGLPTLFTERLLQSSETMTQCFAHAIQAKAKDEELKHLSAAVLSLRDCAEVLDICGPAAETLRMQYRVLHQRLEAMCLALANDTGEKKVPRWIGTHAQRSRSRMT